MNNLTTEPATKAPIDGPIRYWVGFVLETAWYWGIRIIGALILLSMLIGDTLLSQF